MPGAAVSSCCRWRPLLVLLVVAGLLLSAWGAFTRWKADPEPDASGDPPAVEDEDSRLRRLVVGTWQDEYQGKRTMTLREDGTGTMLVELTGFRALLAAKRLTFEMTWAVQDGRLTKRTVGGEPAGTVQMILKAKGDRVDEPILELTQDRLLLLDKDGKTRYDWRRVRPK